MVDLDASTPQLRAIKNWLDAFISLDIKNVEPLLSKNFQYHPFPETADVPKEAKEKYMERFGGAVSVASKAEVIYHEVIEAPGKVVLHLTGVVTTILGATLPYDTVVIVTLVEEDGELKVLQCKDFADPQKRDAFFAGVIKAAAGRVVA